MGREGCKKQVQSENINLNFYGFDSSNSKIWEYFFSSQSNRTSDWHLAVPEAI